MSQVVTDIERGRRDVGAVGFLGPEEPSLVENSAVISGGPEALVAGPEAPARDEAAANARLCGLPPLLGRMRAGMPM